MGRITVELSDETIRRATMLATAKGMPLHTFLAHQINELIAANERYERAKASVLAAYPEIDGLSAPADQHQFFDRWRDRQ
jgi:hypothetical protein